MHAIQLLNGIALLLFYPRGSVKRIASQPHVLSSIFSRRGRLVYVVTIQQRHRKRRGAFFSADESQFLRGGGFDGNLRRCESQSLGDILAHLLGIRHDFRRFQD